MLALLAALIVPKIEPGAYELPELCKLLTNSTGKFHSVEPVLCDYPVLVSVKSGDPVRIESLTAAAMHSEWVPTKGGVQLKWIRPKPSEGFEDFKKSLLNANKSEKLLSEVSAQDLYELPPGNILRYGYAPSEYVKQAPESLLKSLGKDFQTIRIRRMAPGVFEFAGMNQVTFAGLPSDVSKLLGASIDSMPMKPSDLVALGKLMSDPREVRKEWKIGSSRDPITTIQQVFLTPIASAFPVDIVMALPDFSLFALLEPSTKLPKAGEILGKYAVSINWKVVDGAVVGQLPPSEFRYPTQASRDVLRRFLADENEKGISNINTLSQYVLAQQPTASNCWLDVMLLVLSGKIIDQEFIGDYPYNIRLYGKLDQDDWKRIRSGKSFSAGEFSLPVRKELTELLIHARSRLSENGPAGVVQKDPAIWKSLDPSQIFITPNLEESQVLIGYTMPGGEIKSAHESGLNYEMRRQHSASEPTYQPAQKRNLKLRIYSGFQGEEVQTGFSEVTPDQGKPVGWTQLPGSCHRISDQFRAGSCLPWNWST